MNLDNIVKIYGIGVMITLVVIAIIGGILFSISLITNYKKDLILDEIKRKEVIEQQRVMKETSDKLDSLILKTRQYLKDNSY